MASSAARRFTATPRAGPSSSAAVADPSNHFPEYQPPSAALNASGHQALRNIATRSQNQLVAHLRAAIEYLDSSAGQINERVTERKEAASLKRKREATDGQTEDARRLTAHLSALEPKVEAMTGRIEEAVRQTIDGKEMAAQLETALRQVKEHAITGASQATATQRSEWDPTMPGQTQDGMAPPCERFRQMYHGHKDRYRAMTLSVRYSEHPDYVKFKRSVHMAKQSGDKIAPMPRSETWFQDGPNAEDDDEDDMVMEGERIRTTCPITLAPFREPLSSDLCPHHFEKSAIMELIRKSTSTAPRRTPRGDVQNVRAVQCPTPGCDQMLSACKLSVSQSFIRTLKRLQRLQEARENGYDDEDGDDSRRNNSVVLGSDDDDGYAEVDDDDAAGGSSGPRVKVSSSAVVPATTRTNGVADNIGDLGRDSDEEE